jgi:hypothetical protein
VLVCAKVARVAAYHHLNRPMATAIRVDFPPGREAGEAGEPA